MLHSITIQNFRKLDRFSLRLRAGNVLVGPNNAGKSSILDGFRLLESCLRYTKTKNPSLISVPGHGVVAGYVLPDTVLPFAVENLSTNYNSERTVFEFTHINKNKLTIEISENQQGKMYLEVPGRTPKNSSTFRAAFPIDVIIIPTLAPLETEEAYVTDETVRRNSYNRLASRIFRNIWLRRSLEDFEEFRADVEEAWSGIRLNKPELIPSQPARVSMTFEENRILREVQWAGFGFQVWLQIHSHLRRPSNNPLLIIDEPDVYLHPDLQRRLFRTVKRRFSQFVMATHATEIINEADAEEIVSINPRYRNAKRIVTDEEYTDLHRYIGSSDNADFARIAKSKKVIFVEGKDGRLLRKFANRFGFRHLSDAQGVPIIQLGGFSEWRRADSAVWAFKNILKLEVSTFCLFDRDYRCKDEIESFIDDRKKSDIPTWVLDRKEIENYLLSPLALLKAVQRRLLHQGKRRVVDINYVEKVLYNCADEIRGHILGQICSNQLRYASITRSSLDNATLISTTQKQLEEKFQIINNFLSIVPGKEILSKFNEFLQCDLGASLTDTMIIDAMDLDSTAPDLRDLLFALDQFCKDAN